MSTDANRDRLARNLYEPRRFHAPPCNAALSLYDDLVGRCPACGKTVSSATGPLDRSHADEMLVDLQARRVAMGLTP